LFCFLKGRKICIQTESIALKILSLYFRRIAVDIRPLGDRVLIEVMEDELQKQGVLYIPDTAKEKPQQGKVVAVGKGRFEDGKLIPLDVKDGDLVLYGKYAGSEIKHNGKEYLIVRENDILAVFVK
jgi:chaperonin GroES